MNSTRDKVLIRSSPIILRKSVLTCRKAEFAFFSIRIFFHKYSRLLLQRAHLYENMIVILDRKPLFSQGKLLTTKLRPHQNYLVCTGSYCCQESAETWGNTG